MLSIIKSAIKRFGSQKKFAEEVGMRQATLSDFLNEKLDIRVSTLGKIMDKAGLEIASAEPNKLMERDAVILNGNSFHVGDFVDRHKKVQLCFGSTHTTRQGVVIKDVESGEVELMII